MAYDPRTATGIPTEPIGSLPRPVKLQAAFAAYDAGEIAAEALAAEQDAAVKDSIERFEATGSPIITDGEQRWSSFATYPFMAADKPELAGQMWFVLGEACRAVPRTCNIAAGDFLDSKMQNPNAFADENQNGRVDPDEAVSGGKAYFDAYRRGMGYQPCTDRARVLAAAYAAITSCPGRAGS